MTIEIGSIWESIKSALACLPTTLFIISVSLLIGLVIGTFIALIRFYHVPILSEIFAVFVTIYQGIPSVTIFLIYNLIYIMLMPDILKALHIQKNIADISMAGIGIFALSLSAICSLSEVIRGALESVDPGQMEAGNSIGLTTVQTIRRIILPQVIPVVISPITNSIVGLIKASAILSVIGIAEITYGASQPSFINYAFFESYLAAACVYWLFTICIEQAAGLLERRCGKFRRTI